MTRPGSAQPGQPGKSWGGWRWGRWLRGHWFLFMPGAAVSALVLLFHQWTDYTSDSVAQQSIVRTWLDAGHGVAYVPSDTWIFKLPLYLGVESLPFSPGARLLLEVLILNVASLVLLGPAAWWLVRSVRAGAGRPHPIDVVAPLIWLATLGGELGANRMQPNYRNIELGLSFVALAVAARQLDLRADRPRVSRSSSASSSRARAAGEAAGGVTGSTQNASAGYTRARFVQQAGQLPDEQASGSRPDLWRQKLGAVLAAVLLALLWVDDPYFAVLVGVPFGGLCVVWLFLRKWGQYRYFVAAIVITASLVLVSPLHKLLVAMGYDVLSSPAAPTGGLNGPSGFWSARLSAAGVDLGAKAVHQNFHLLGPAVAAQLGLADSDPSSIVPGTGRFLSVPASGANTLILMLAVAAGLALSWHGWRSRQVLPTFLGVHWLLVAAGFCVSARVSEVAHGRYLILAFYDLAVTLAVVLPALRSRWPGIANAIIGLLAASVVLNVASAVVTGPEVYRHQWERLPVNEPGPSGPDAERAVQQAVASTGLRRGYAQFWNANLTLYRTGGRVSVNAVTCVGGHLGAENWLTDTARRTAPSPGGTFLIYEPANGHFWGCPESAIEAQLGTPVRRIPAGPGATVLVYAGDIGPRIPAQPMAG